MAHPLDEHFMQSSGEETNPDFHSETGQNISETEETRKLRPEPSKSNKFDSAELLVPDFEGQKDFDAASCVSIKSGKCTKNSSNSKSLEENTTDEEDDSHRVVPLRGNLESSCFPPERCRSMDLPDNTDSRRDYHVKKSASIATATDAGLIPIAESCRSASGYMENTSPECSSYNSRKERRPNDTSASMINMLSSSGEPYGNETDTLPFLVKEDENCDSRAVCSIIEPKTQICALSKDDVILELKVDKPQKILSAMDTYVNFRVWTKIKNSEGAVTEHDVHRRYSDFVWLRSRLQHENSMLILPPLPEKHSVYSLDRFDPNFIRARCYLLHLFMQALLQHSVVGKNPEIWIFVTAELQEWVSHKKQAGSSTLGALYNNLATVRHATSAVSKSEFHKVTDLCHDLNLTLSALEKMTLKLHSAECQCDEELSRIQVVLEHWAETERSSKLKGAVEKMQESFEKEESALTDLTGLFEAKFSLPVKHWAFYAESVKHVLKCRDSLNGEQVLASELLKKRLDAEKQVGNLNVGRSEEKAKQLLDEAETKSKNLDRDLREANAELRKELKTWSSKKENDLVSILREMALGRAEYHRKSLESWEKTLAEMAENSVPNSSQLSAENGTLKHNSE